jgi:hemerythrin
MESFHWDAHFVTGLDEVDDQHHHLVDVLNQLSEILTHQEGVDFDAVEVVFGELAAYAQYHFEEEETLVKNVNVDIRHCSYHFEEHKNFLKEVTLMHSTVRPENPDDLKSLLKFLTYWLAYHILGSDQTMAKQVLSIRSGNSPDAAYQSEEKMKEGAVEPLLDALNGLFKQVSERNSELLELNKTLEARVAKRTRELAAANKRLEIIALTDVLTGLPNRRHAMNKLAETWNESLKENTPLSCIMIDADGFKQINDNFGHDAGDETLRHLSRCLQDSIRNDDLVCRLGGDEFFVICPRTPTEGAALLAEKLCKKIASLQVKAGQGVWRGSISVGVASRKEHMKSYEELIKASDDGVYMSKRNGRGCVSVIN